MQISFYVFRHTNVSRDSSLGIVASYGLADREIGVRFPREANIGFPFSVSSRSALGSTKIPIQWVPVIISQGVKWLRPEADLHLMPRLRMGGDIPPLFHKSSWHSA
jgi:hypothetical protein